MFFAVFFAFWRFMQIITLIIVVGMLSWFVNGYVTRNELTPNFILVLFIVSVLGLAWAIFTLFSYHRSSTNSLFVSVVDLAFVGAFIAGVWYLRGIRNIDCTNVTRDGNWQANFGSIFSVSGADWDINTDKPCAMLKASWAFAIMNCCFFFFTAVLAWFHGDRMSAQSDRKYSRDSHHHRRSGSHHSHHSRRSSRSHRVYV